MFLVPSSNRPLTTDYRLPPFGFVLHACPQRSLAGLAGPAVGRPGQIGFVLPNGYARRIHHNSFSVQHLPVLSLWRKLALFRTIGPAPATLAALQARPHSCPTGANWLCLALGLGAAFGCHRAYSRAKACPERSRMGRRDRQGFRCSPSSVVRHPSSLLCVPPSWDILSTILSIVLILYNKVCYL